MSKIEVNQISSQCGSTLTIGQSGDTVTLACGATQTGFGRSGSVNWDTTAKTTGFTAVSGNGYFVNTTSGAITVTLPASPSAGDIVSISDYAGTTSTNNITIARNGSNINGDASDLTISKNNSGITLVYVDGTQGWKATETSNLNDIELQAAFIVGTGGTETTCGNFKIHTFTGPGTFTVTCAGNPVGSNTVSYLVVAGGGGGGGDQPNGYGAGGGGAGGFRESKAETDSYTASPLNATSGPTYNLPVTAQAYPITVGGGGAAGATGGGGNGTQGSRGATSTFSTISSTGGGGGNIGAAPVSPSPAPGGSGGGGSGPCSTNAQGSGGTGNTPPVSPSQGFPGGNARTPATSLYGGGGGGGASAKGEDFITSIPGNTAGDGGAGVTTSISGSPTAYSGGGGAGAYNSLPLGQNTTDGAGGNGGGGPGGEVLPGNSHNAGSGTANTGGGGGGAASNYPSTPGVVDAGAGGSGIVIIRYKYQ